MPGVKVSWFPCVCTRDSPPQNRGDPKRPWSPHHVSPATSSTLGCTPHILLQIAMGQDAEEQLLYEA